MPKGIHMDGHNLSAVNVSGTNIEAAIAELLECRSVTEIPLNGGISLWVDEEGADYANFPTPDRAISRLAAAHGWNEGIYGNGVFLGETVAGTPTSLSPEARLAIVMTHIEQEREALIH